MERVRLGKALGKNTGQMLETHRCLEVECPIEITSKATKLKPNHRSFSLSFQRFSFVAYLCLKFQRMDLNKEEVITIDQGRL